MTGDHKGQKDLVFCGCSLERYKKVPEYTVCTHAWVLTTEAIYLVAVRFSVLPWYACVLVLVLLW